MKYLGKITDDKDLVTKEYSETYTKEYLESQVSEVKTATVGSIVSFDDGADNIPLKDLKVNLAINQPLHGQANPYPAGGGKNLVQNTETSQTIDDVTYTINADGTVATSGTPSISTGLTINRNFVLPAGTYILSGCPSGGGSNKFALICTIANQPYYDYGNGKSLTFTEEVTVSQVRIVIYANQNTAGLVFNPMICLSSATDPTDYAPYSNICPIYPVTEAEVSVSGKNLFDPAGIKYGTYSGTTWSLVTFSLLTPITNTSFKPETQYTFSGTATQSEANKNLRIQIIYTDGTSTNLWATNSASPVPFAVASEAGKSIAYLALRFGNSGASLTVENFQIEVGTTATGYEPYAGSTTLVNIGINQWDEEWEVGTIDNSTGLPDTDANNIRSKNFCPCIAGASYNIVSKDSKVLRYYFYDKSQTFISGGATSGTNTIVTAPTGACYFKVRTTSSYGSTYLSDISVNFPSRFTDYHAYTGNVVYGGELDVTTGVLTGKYAKQIFDGSENWGFNTYETSNRATFLLSNAPTGTATNNIALSYVAPNAIPSASQPDPWTAVINVNGYLIVGLPTTITTLAEWKAYLASNPLEIVYPLATPLTIQLDPTEVDTLRGDNVIFCDTGNIIDCEYWSSGLLTDEYAGQITKELSEKANINSPNFSGIPTVPDIVSNSPDNQIVNKKYVDDNNSDTTYTFANGTNGFTVTPSGGTAQTVTVTPSIANNVTGSGTSGYIAKFNGTNTITNGPAFGSATTTYLRNDGNWATPTDTKNTAGSTASDSKMFLIGATSQAANPQTYSNANIYGTAGVLNATSFSINAAANIVYNSTDKSIDFTFN